MADREQAKLKLLAILREHVDAQIIGFVVAEILDELGYEPKSVISQITSEKL